MELTEKLEQLLLEKPFEQLSKEEQHYVRSQISEEEYEQYQQLVQNSKTVFANYKGKPKPAVKAALMARVKQNKKKAGVSLWAILAGLFTYRLPAWQAALGVVLLMGAFWWFGQNEGVTTTQPEIVYIPTDTVYKEIVKTVSEIADTSGKTVSIRPIQTAMPDKKASKSSPVTFDKNISVESIPNVWSKNVTASDTSSNPVVDYQKMEREKKKGALMHFNKSPRGRTAKEDSAALKFIVEIY